VTVAAVCTMLLMVYAAYSRPWYFNNSSNLVGLVALEFLIVAVWLYRRAFYPVVLVTFLMAGSNLPVGSGWSAGRWVVLAVGASVGLILVVKDRGYRFGLFHLLAFFGVLTAVISAAVSLYPNIALLKVLSLLLLFVYAGTGARMAVTGREDRFFRGLLIGCEIFVAANAFFYAVGIQAMGNPNSLGATMGMAAAPILLWGVLLGGDPSVHRRRIFLYTICMYMVFMSRARAGMAAAVISSAILCIALRRYKLLIQGLVVLAIVGSAASIVRPELIPSEASSLIYKDQEEGILMSRVSPWKTALDSIRDHPWFGTGLGTAATDFEVKEGLGMFASSQSVTKEHGSSFLAVFEGVGLVGVIPLFLLLGLLLIRVFRTLVWMRQSGLASHAAVPLAIAVFASFVHAVFEDWMFAPGNYLCVFFWTLAFILNDVAPRTSFSGLARNWNPKPVQHVANGVVPSR